MKEFRVQGPPGTGKSTYIRRQCQLAAESYGANKVVVCSLTKAAAANLIENDIPIPRDNVGTLHSLAYRALPGVDIAETHLEVFNEFCSENRQPGMRLASSNGNPVDDANRDNDIVTGPIGGQGDQLLQQMNIYRARMIDRAVWPEGVKAFAKWWDSWKHENGYVDFTDLLEIALRDVDKCPGEPAALMADESQDFTKLAFTLARKWGEQCERWIQVGDPDQVLFAWAGVTIESFFGDLPPEQTRVLHQSYRVPRAVHSYAVKWIESTPGRSAVHYEPREAAGAVRRLSARYVEPTAAVADCQRQVAAGRSCMFLVSCSYMLSKIIALLRDGGIPFHNPYRVSRGDWNPLRIGANSPAARLAAFNVLQHEKRIWTNQELWRWVEWLPTATLQRGSKTSIQRDAKDCPAGVRDGVAVLRLFKPEYGNAVMDGDQAWFLSMIDEESKRKLAYPLRIAERCGVAALQETPRVIVSTIHAAKGGEADVIFLFPDLSPQGYTEWMGGREGKEGVRRAFYVALTRAREELVICQAASTMAVRL